MEYATQVGTNLVKGQSFKDAAFNNVDFKEVAISGATEALSGGFGKAFKALKTMNRFADGADAVSDVSKVVNKADDLKESAKVGREAHRQIQKELAKDGYAIEKM
jgi:hypothetical protein